MGRETPKKRSLPLFPRYMRAQIAATCDVCLTQLIK
jgi:hypothetical protein